MDEQPVSTSASMTMADENIRRIDILITDLDQLLLSVLEGDGMALYKATQYARIIFMNIRNNLGKVNDDLMKKINQRIKELDVVVMKGDLEKENAEEQFKIREKVLDLGDMIHQGTDEIGIGITVKKKEKSMNI